MSEFTKKHFVQARLLGALISFSRGDPALAATAPAITVSKTDGVEIIAYLIENRFYIQRRLAYENVATFNR